MSSYLGLFLLLLSISQDLRVAAYDLKINQLHTRVSKDRNRVTVKCHADMAFTGCQFRWWDRNGSAGPLMDFSSGSQSERFNGDSTDDVLGYEYYGSGLDQGECGLKLHIQGWKCWMVSCRVHVKGGGWTYKWMDIYAEIWGYLPNTLDQREVVVLPGDEARLMMKGTRPLSCCRFHLPSTSERIDFDQGAWSAQSTGRHRYYGAGLESGECGLVLTNITEADNGPSRAYIRSTSPFIDDQRFNPMIVARQPSFPDFRADNQGSNVTATCSVQQSRPIANITWYLGNDVIRRDSVDDSPSSPGDEWRWPWMSGAIMQRVQLSLTPSDEMRELKCVVTHVTLQQPLVSSKSFRAAPAAEHSNQSTATCASILDALRQDNMGSSGEIYDLRVLEARAALEAAKSLARAKLAHALAAELEVETARTRARVELVRALARELEVEAARTHARTEQVWATNAEEELQFERKRRSGGTAVEKSQTLFMAAP